METWERAIYCSENLNMLLQHCFEMTVQYGLSRTSRLQLQPVSLPERGAYEVIECADPELILQLVCIILHPNCIPTRFPNFSEFSVAVPRIGTGSEVGLCVDAAEKLDKKAQNQSISLKDLFSNNKR